MTSFGYVRTYSLPRGYEIELSLDNGRLECRWSPDVPRGQRARRLLPFYREARDKFIISLGVNTLVIEL
jgi:hypothetical protein